MELNHSNNSKHRFKVRVVAIIDLILTVICVCFPFLIFLVVVNLTFALIDRNTSARYDFTLTSWVIGLWLLFVIVLIAVILEIVSAIKLVNSTANGIEPQLAVKLARFWRNCTIIFTSILILVANIGGRGMFLMPSNDGRRFHGSSILGINLCFRAIGVFIVQQYIREMEERSRLLPTVFHNVSGRTPIVVMNPLPPHRQAPPAYFSIPPQIQAPHPPHNIPYGAYPYYPSGGIVMHNSPPPDYEEAIKRF